MEKEMSNMIAEMIVKPKFKNNVPIKTILTCMKLYVDTRDKKYYELTKQYIRNYLEVVEQCVKKEGDYLRFSNRTIMYLYNLNETARKIVNYK